MLKSAAIAGPGKASTGLIHGLCAALSLIAAPASAELMERHSLQNNHVEMPSEVVEASRALEDCLGAGVQALPMTADFLGGARTILAGCQAQMEAYRLTFEQMISTLPIPDAEKDDARYELLVHIGRTTSRLEGAIRESQGTP